MKRLLFSIAMSISVMLSWAQYSDSGSGTQSDPPKPITFADPAVESLCVANWDTNHDGVLTMVEATAVTSLGEVFMGNREITSFDELQYFTGLTSIGNSAFDYCSNLTSVTIPESVTSIGPWAFYGCSGLTSVTIPESVTSIGKSAFWGCSGLTSVTIPESVTSIGESAFANCYGLNAIIVDDGNTKYDSRDNCNAIIETATNTLIYGCKSTVIPESVTSIGDEAFNNCSDLTSVTIPESVTSIGNLAFYYCTGLTSVTIPESVTSIGVQAFWGCSGLTSVTIPESVTSIGKGAFLRCSGLTSVNIPNSITSIVNGAFEYCSGLTSVTIPESVTSIGSYAFRGCSGLTSVTIPESVTSIGYEAFYGCSGLTSVTIPESVTSIGYEAFYGCSGLTSVTIPESVTSIDYEAFYGCSGLTSVTIPESVTSIGEGAFWVCSGLTSVTIPESVTSIGDYAFSRCSGLTSVTIPESVTSIGNGAFADCYGLTEIHWTPNADTDLSSSLANAYLTSTSRTLYLHNTADNAAMVDHLVSSLAGKFKEIIVNIDDLMRAYNAAMASIKEDNYYQIYTLVDGIPYFLTNTGTLTANEEEAYSFKMTTARRSGTKYETGWNTSVPFTFPTLTNGSTGDIVNDGSIHRNSNNRDDFERQVFFEVAGKYAVRATNSGSTNWGANTYWAQVGTTELPEAGYSLDPSFIWMLNDVTGPAILAEARAIVEAKEGVGPNLFQKSEEDYESFSVAVDDAAAVIESTTASSEEKDAAITALRTALDAYNNVYNLPDPSKAYTFQQKASGLFMGLSANGVKLALPENASELFFEAGENGGYFIHDAEGQYVGFEGSNNWRMSTSADKKYEWKVTYVGDNYYTLSKPSNANHHVGTNDNDKAEGAPCYADKNNSDNSYYLWKIAQVNINFADDNVKALCVANWDTNHDGELSYNEAAAVTSLGEVFKGNTEITSFDELQYFTGLTDSPLPVHFALSTWKTSAKYDNIVITSDGTTLYQNDFSIESLADWTNNGGQWQVENGALCQTDTGMEGNLFTLNSLTLGNNYTIDLDATKVEGDEGFLISFNVANGRNYSWWNIGGWSNTKTQLEEKIDGMNNPVGNESSLTVENGRTYHITIAVNNGNVKCYLDGEQIHDYNFTVLEETLYHAFEGCSNLASVVMPENITEIGDLAFDGCTGLTSVVIPSNVTTIGEDAFSHCPMTTVTIPESVSVIRSWAFSDCTALTSVTIPKSVTSIGINPFSNCLNLNTIMVATGNEIYNSHDNCNAIVETATNTLISGCKNTMIPNSVTSIGDHAFRNCSGLTTVTIPNSVTSIGNWAFYQCDGLTSLTIPESVTSIGYWGFADCYGLTSVTIPESVTSIDAAFWGCWDLTEIHWTPNADTNLSSSLSSANLTSTDRTLYLYKNAGNATMVDQLVISLDGQFKEIIVVIADNELSVEDSKVCRGAELVLPVSMYNKETITAFQFQVSLPEGISLTKCELTDRKGSDHTVSFTKKANGNYQVVAISMTSAPFSGNEGELLNLTLEVDENMKADDYTIGITNIELTTKQAEAIELSDLNASLTVLDVMLGDINADGRVTITDAVGIVNYILDNPPSKFIYEAADMNQDNKVSITDAVAIVNFILSEEQSANVRRAMDAFNQRFADTLDPQ